LLLLSETIDQVNKRGCLVSSVNLSGITLLRNARTVLASALQLPLLCDLSLSNTKLGDSGMQLLLDLLLSLDKQAPIRSLLQPLPKPPFIRRNNNPHAAPSSRLKCHRMTWCSSPPPANGTH
jgi:hypothetical protein